MADGSREVVKGFPDYSEPATALDLASVEA